MSEKKISEMKWNEIPDSTPLYEILCSIGFPEPMIILKQLNNKKSKNGKKHDLNTVVSLLWTSKEDIQIMLESLYETASRNISRYLVNHPSQALLLVRTINQIDKEPLSVVAERNLNEWRKLFIEEDVWNSLMKETPLTIIGIISKIFTENDYANMPLGEYYAKFGAETFFEKASIKAIGDKLFEAEEKERKEAEEKERQMNAMFEAMFESMFKSPGMDDVAKTDTDEFTS